MSSGDATNVGQGTGGGGYGPPQGGGGQGGGGYAPQGPAVVEDDGGSKKPLLIVAGILAVLLLVGVGVLLSGLLGKDDDSASGEVFLAPAASLGPDPYAVTPLAPEPDPALALPATETGASVPGSGSVSANLGGKPGLYGGTMNMASCDPQQLVAFLAANPQKAAAWVAALTADPEVSLPDGSPLTVASIPQYVASLTPVTLMVDTRVTNHGYKNAKPTRLQSVLQKGSAVLVDNKGVPRTKCYCGNPLLPPVGVSGTPTYTGAKWPDFDPSKVQSVQQSTTVINVFQLQDTKTGTLFNRPPGSTGANDTPAGPTTTPDSTTTTATTAPPSSTAPATSSPSTTTTTAAPASTTAPAATTDKCSPSYVPPGATKTILYIENPGSSSFRIGQQSDDPGCGTVQQYPVAAGGQTAIDTYVGQQFSGVPAGGGDSQSFSVTAPDQTWTLT